MSESNEEKKKKSILKKWWFWLIIIIVISVIGSQEGTSNNSSDNNGINKIKLENKSESKLENKIEVTMIDFSAMTINEITSWCNTNKVECYKKEEYSNTISKGEFISQSVKMGEKIYEGDKIDIVYSLGKESTLSQKNALKNALSYLDYSAFSYKSLIKQLEFEKYSHADAVYAVDNCGANWNEQAVKKGQSYLDYTAFSKQGLIDQLEFEGFTTDQVNYAVNKLGF